MHQPLREAGVSEMLEYQSVYMRPYESVSLNILKLSFPFFLLKSTVFKRTYPRNHLFKSGI